MKREYTILSPKVKEKIIKKYLNGESPMKLSKKYNFTRQHFYVWLKKYQENGLDGLISNSGKNSNGNKGKYLRKPKSKVEELETNEDKTVTTNVNDITDQQNNEVQENE